jgi:site-specific DNA-methyltransferase (adenine-specific)
VNGEVIHGEAVEVLRWMLRRRGYDKRDVVMMTDPAWPGCEHVPINGALDPVGAWRPVAELAPRVGNRLILWLGHNTDPREMVGAVPTALTFKTVVTLRQVPPGYRGCLMGGDLAYVFADQLRVPEGQHVLPGEIVSNGPQHRHERNQLQHPCPRSPQHARGLVRWYAARASLIVDPFCGSGTTLVAAAELGVRFMGIDSDLRWVEESRARLDRVTSQGLLDFDQRRPL